MTEEPKNTKPPESDDDASQEEPTETVREKFERLIAGNPRFVKAKPSGSGIVIIGARPPKGKD